jgi:hypothetical protein
MALEADQSLALKFDLPVITSAVAELVGLLQSDGSVNAAWFEEPVTELEQIRDRFDVLVGVLPDLLGAASTPPAPPHTGWSWYPVPNPETDAATPLNVVVTSAGTMRGLGLGVLLQHALGDGSVEALAEVPLIAWTAGANPAAFEPGPIRIGLTVQPGSSGFPALTLLVAIPLEKNASPTFALSVGSDTYTSLAAVEQQAVVDALNKVISGCKPWLATKIGESSATVATMLEGGGLIKADGNGGYVLTLDTLTSKGPVGSVKGALGALANSNLPIVPLAGGGIYVAHDNEDWGLRVQTTEDISVQVAGEQVSLALGTFVAGDTATDNWISRSLGTAAPDPGLALYVLNDSRGFSPRIRLVEVGLNVAGTGGKPVVSQAGYTLKAFEARCYIDSLGWPYGFGVALDTVGFPVVPSGASGDSSNPVAHDLVDAGGDKGGDKEPANPSFSASVGRAWSTSGSGTVSVRLSDPTGHEESRVWVPIQRAFGPLQLRRIGVEWDDPNPDYRLGLLLDASVMLSMLEVDLLALSLEIPLTAPGDIAKYEFGLDGLALSYTSAELTISGGFVKNTVGGTVEYDGQALIKAGKWALAAIGSYAAIKDKNSGESSTSLFIFAQLEAELGGPPFFFVTGLCAGFGYNRSLKTPSIDKVDAFPLLAGVADPGKIGGKDASPKDALEKMADWIEPERGADWIAAGVQFTSFELARSNVVAVIVFGNQFRVLILGVSRMKLGQAGPQFAYIELELEVVIDPAQGLFSAEAVLAPASYVLDPDCHLTGGFAFYVWYSGDHAGDFVVTVGGYHPAFNKPAWYPDVPRLGFSWFPGADITIQGDAYFALTPSCVMGGGGLDVEFHSGDLHAWFKAQADFLFHWKPFYFEGGVGVSIGASYKLELAFVSVTIRVELGASLSIHGPPTGGSVHIDWYIISFTIPFGSDPSGAGGYIEWTDFASLLPQPKSESLNRPAAARALAETELPAQPLKILISDGLLKVAPDGTWLVRADALTLEVDTAFPATQIVLDGPSSVTEPTTPDALCVRPMGISSATSVLTITVSEDNGPVQDLGSLWSSTLKRGAVPAAMWGAVLDANSPPPPSSDLVCKKIVGVSGLTPKQAQPVGPPPMPATNLEYAPIDKGDSNWLPLSTTEPVVARAPQPSTEALHTIHDTLVGAGAERTAVYDTLVALAADPLQNGAVDAVVADLAVDFADEPLLGAPWQVAR